MTHTYYTYLITNKNNTALYTGMTNNIRRRVWEHQFDKGSKFTSKYNCNKLVYFEEFDSPMAAIEREKQLKAGSRAKKEALINKDNADWLDLSEGWFDRPVIARLFSSRGNPQPTKVEPLLLTQR